MLAFMPAAISREIAITSPPVNSHFCRLVHGRDEQADLDRKKLDVYQADSDVAGDDDTLVQNAFQHIHQTLARRLRRAGDGSVFLHDQLTFAARLALGCDCTVQPAGI